MSSLGGSDYDVSHLPSDSKRAEFLLAIVPKAELGAAKEEAEVLAFFLKRAS